MNHYIYIYIRGDFNKFFVQAFKIVVDSRKVCYCYTFYEMTYQFL